MTRTGSTWILSLNRFDILGRILFGALGFGYAKLVAMLWALGLFELWILPWGNGYIIPIWEYFWLAVIVPVFWIYYASSQFRIPRLFQSVEEQCIVERTEQYDEFVTSAKHSLGLPVWPLIAFIGSGLTMFLIVYVGWAQQPPPYLFSNWHTTYSLFWTFFNGYVALLAAIREVVTFFWLNRFFSRFPIRVQPLHHDGAGGLGFIGKHYLGLTVFIIAIGYWLSFWNFLTPLVQGTPMNLSMEVLLGLTIYMVAAPVSFFLPLASVHRAMEREKNAILQELSVRFNSHLGTMRSNLDKETDVFVEMIEKGKKLQELYQIIEKTYPTWPYNISTLRNFSISATIPILTNIVSFAIGMKG